MVFGELVIGMLGSENSMAVVAAKMREEERTEEAELQP